VIAFLIVVIWLFVVLPYIFRRVMPPAVVIEPTPAVTVFTPSIIIHVHLNPGA
jgi:hypothetical protein